VKVTATIVILSEAKNPSAYSGEILRCAQDDSFAQNDKQ